MAPRTSARSPCSATARSFRASETKHTDGYDYTERATMQSVQVYGARCDKIMKGTIRDVTVTFAFLVT